VDAPEDEHAALRGKRGVLDVERPDRTPVDAMPDDLGLDDAGRGLHGGGDLAEQVAREPVPGGDLGHVQVGLATRPVDERVVVRGRSVREPPQHGAG
jgi:hypothetical protein